MRGRKHKRTQNGGAMTIVNTPEAMAPEDEPVDMEFEPIREEPQYFNEDEHPSSYDPDIAEVLDGPMQDALALLDADEEAGRGAPSDDDGEDDLGADDTEDTESTEDDQDAGDPDTEDVQDVGNPAADVPLEAIPPADLAPPVTDSGRTFRQGDVLNDQTALLDADADAEREQQEEDMGDRMPIDPEPDEDEEEDEITDDSPDVESDEEPKKESPIYRIPLIGPALAKVRDTIHRIKEFRRTFYDPKYWKRQNGWHGNMVRSKMMKEGKEKYVFLHRVWWDLKLGCYRDDIMFVKERLLTKQHPRHLSRYGIRAIPDQSTGEYVIFNSKLTPPEYEGENGFTASSAYLFMMDTSGEKAIKESTVDLKSKDGPDRFFIILIGGAFIIIFGYFLLGGFGHRW